MRSWLRRSLWDVVPRDHQERPEALRRRRLVSAVVVVVGAGMLAVSLRIEAGSPWFYPATFAMAAVWTVGAFASGPLHLGRIARGRDGDGLVRPVLAPVLLGLALAGLCLVGGLAVREIPWLDRQASSVADLADQGLIPLLVLATVANGAAEELFFRGAAYAAVPRHPVAWTTVAYVTATLATGNAMLTLAAVVLGVAVGLERRASGGILAPILTHCTWSVAMLLILPLLFG